MSLKNARGGPRPLTPIGNHVARLCQIIDLGTQDDIKYGPKQKVRFTWELSEEFKDFGKGEQEPFLISRVMTFAFSPKSNLKKLIEGMKGSPLSDDEISNLDQTLRNLIGTPCMINIVHVKVGDQSYANVEGVAPVPAKLRKGVPPLHNDGIFFETEMGPESREFLLLPDFIKSQIAKCHEWSHGAQAPEDEDEDGQQVLNFG
jgi:hypothetical protein